MIAGSTTQILMIQHMFRSTTPPACRSIRSSQLRTPGFTSTVATYPNFLPFSSARRGTAFQSAVYWNTVLPHHAWIVSFPIPPFSGYCKLQCTPRHVSGTTAQPSTANAPKVQQDGRYGSPSIESRGQNDYVQVVDERDAVSIE